MRRVIMITALPLLLAACQGASSVPVSTRSIDADRVRALSPTFSEPHAPSGKGPPSVAWIFVTNGEVGNVDVYSAKTHKLISQCSCTGVGLAVNPPDRRSSRWYKVVDGNCLARMKEVSRSRCLPR